MALILSDQDVADLVSPPECVDPLVAAYRDAAERLALSRPRSDVHLPLGDGSFYVFKSMEGALPSQGVVALRINSHRIGYYELSDADRDVLRKRRQPSS